MVSSRLLAILLLTFLNQIVFSQQPRYTPKHFVSADDPQKFVRIVPKADGFMRTYLLTDTEIWDTDDDNTTYVKSGKKVLICMEGQYKNGQRDGVFTAYVLDSLDQNTRYKIFEQTYSNNRLNGPWRSYTLKGKLAGVENYVNDSISGTSKFYWIDGKSLMRETVHLNGHIKVIQKEYSGDGVVIEETTFENGVPNGPAKKYYPNGVLQDEVILMNGLPNGVRKYYYPSGKLWIEQEMKEGKPWTVIGNYTESGQKRDAGTLKNGNGTVIFYNEDNSVREVVTYKNGVEQ